MKALYRGANILILEPPTMMRSRLLAKKSVAQIRSEFDSGQLRRTLGPLNLVSLGIGAIIGSGIFVMTGGAAANFAGSWYEWEADPANPVQAGA